MNASGKPRLLFISRPFQGVSDTSGEQTYARNLSPHLEFYFDATFVRQVGSIPPKQAIFSIPFYDWLHVIWLLFRHLFKRYDLVMFCSPFQAGLSRLFKLRRCKVVVLVFDAFFDDNGYKTAFDWYSLALYKMTIPRADSVVCFADEIAEQVRRLFRVSTTVCVPISAEIFRRRFDVAAIASREPAPNVGFIGGYCPIRKRVYETLSLLKDNTIPQLLFHYAGPITDVFRHDLAQSGVPPTSYTILGLLTEEEKVEFFANISFLYMPTKLEGIGLPLLEAFHSGVLPIIHADANIPQVVRQYCVAVENHQEALSAIQHYVANPDAFREIITRNYRACSQFRPDRLIQHLFALVGAAFPVPNSPAK